MFKKWDLIIIALLILLSFIPEVIFGAITGRAHGNTYAEITIEGKFYKKIPLSDHRGEYQFKIQTKYGYNIVEVKNQFIAVIDADCKDKIDVKTGFISKPGQNIVCLPHKLMIEVKNSDSKNNDDIIPAS
jgi:hypothetical protein